MGFMAFFWQPHSENYALQSIFNNFDIDATDPFSNEIAVGLSRPVGRDGRIPPFFGRIFVYRIPYTLNISFVINIFEILCKWCQSQMSSDLWSRTHLIIFLKDKAASHTSQLHVSQHYPWADWEKLSVCHKVTTQLDTKLTHARKQIPEQAWEQDGGQVEERGEAGERAQRRRVHAG